MTVHYSEYPWRDNRWVFIDHHFSRKWKMSIDKMEYHCVRAAKCWTRDGDCLCSTCGIWYKCKVEMWSVLVLELDLDCFWQNPKPYQKQARVVSPKPIQIQKNPDPIPKTRTLHISTVCPKANSSPLAKMLSKFPDTQHVLLCAMHARKTSHLWYFVVEVVLAKWYLLVVEICNERGHMAVGNGNRGNI